MNGLQGINTRMNSIGVNTLGRRNQQLDILMRMWYICDIPNIHRLIGLSDMFRASITSLNQHALPEKQNQSFEGSIRISEDSNRSYSEFVACADDSTSNLASIRDEDLRYPCTTLRISG